MKTLKLILLAVGLTGCVTRVPIVLPAPRCAPKLELKPCASPVTLKEGSTYEELIADYQTDRESLQRCARSQKYLLETFADCNQGIDDYNQRVTARPDGQAK
jgi:hypothetical protein